MKRIAMIRDNRVENVSVWDEVSVWNPGPMYTLVEVMDERIGAGYTYDGVSFSPPEPSNMEEMAGCDCLDG